MSKTVCFELITPDIAAKYLETSAGNRRLDMKNVKKYIRDMENESWDCSNDAITFDKEGHLVNGHHRLNAVVKSGKNAEFIVMRDSDCTTFDRGRNRNTEQWLKMNMHYDVQKWEPAMARIHFYYVKNITMPSDNEIHDFLVKHQNSQGILSALCQSRTRTFKTFRNGWAAYGLLSAILTGYNEQKLFRFVDVVNTGFAKDDSESAAIAFRNFLMNCKGNTLSARIEACSVLQSALKKFAAGDSCRIVRKTNGLYYSDVAIKGGVL